MNENALFLLGAASAIEPSILDHQTENRRLKAALHRIAETRWLVSPDGVTAEAAAIKMRDTARAELGLPPA